MFGIFVGGWKFEENEPPGLLGWASACCMPGGAEVPGAAIPGGAAMPGGAPG